MYGDVRIVIVNLLQSMDAVFTSGRVRRRHMYKLPRLEHATSVAAKVTILQIAMLEST